MALPSPWHVAGSLLTLRDQIDAHWPNRSRASDGTVADAAHSSTSDHYPHRVPALGPDYWVTALDITNDPTHGVWSDLLADALVASRDARIKYVISHGRIASNPNYSHAALNWSWRPYDGSDQHINHVHVSVLDAAISNHTNLWALPGVLQPTGGGRVATLDKDDIINVASAVVQWATMDGALRQDLDGANYNLKAVALGLHAKLDTLTHAPVEFTAADVAAELLADDRFKGVLTDAFESALARVRVVVDPAV